MAQKMIDEANGPIAKARVQELINRVKQALEQFWNWVGTNLFSIENFESVEQVADRVLYDLMNKTDLGAVIYSGSAEASMKKSRNNESPTIESKASELGLPTTNSATLANIDAKIAYYIEKTKNVIQKVEQKNGLGPHEFLHELVNIFTVSKSTEQSKYIPITDKIDLRLSDHYSNTKTFADNKNKDENFGVVIKLRDRLFKQDDGVNYLEYVYFPDLLQKDRQIEILNGLKTFIANGNFNSMPQPDKANGSGRFKKIADKINKKIKSSKFIYRQSPTPLEARQHSVEVMRENVEELANVLGVTPEYIYDEKNTKDKGWYDPKDGKVYINLAAHATIEDARQTYLHEVVGHLGLRGLLKGKFEVTMQKVFDSLPKEIQDKYLSKYGNKEKAAEEYLSQMAEMDAEPNIVSKVMGIIRDALRAIGINVGNFTNGDLQYLLWRSKNNLRKNAGYVEAARWGAKDLEVRRRTETYGRPSSYQSNTLAMTNWDKFVDAFINRMRPMEVMADEIIHRGGKMKESSDVLSQEYLSTSRSSGEIEDFTLNRLDSMAKVFAKAMNLFAEKFGMLADDAEKAVYDYLYAKHAPERNKKICIDELIATAKKAISPDKAKLVDEAFLAELNRITEQLYDNQFSGAKNKINIQNVSADQAKLLITLAGVVQKEAKTIASFYAKDAKGNKVYIGNNRSGMNDIEARGIMDRLYNADTASVLDELSDRVKDCTDFTLDKWLEYGMISQEEYDEYKSQYKHYIPLRGWEEKGDETDYSKVPAQSMNSAGLLNLNRHAEGRWSKAENGAIERMVEIDWLSA